MFSAPVDHVTHRDFLFSFFARRLPNASAVFRCAVPVKAIRNRQRSRHAANSTFSLAQDYTKMRKCLSYGYQKVRKASFIVIKCAFLRIRSGVDRRLLILYPYTDCHFCSVKDGRAAINQVPSGSLPGVAGGRTPLARAQKVSNVWSCCDVV